MGVPIHSPFVSVEMVKDHLTLMAAFQRIHQKVEKSGVQLDPTTGLPIPSSAAVLFLARALQRFELWVATLDVQLQGVRLEGVLRSHLLMYSCSCMPTC